MPGYVYLLEEVLDLRWPSNDSKGRLGRFIYIGQTGNLSQRLNLHAIESPHPRSFIACSGLIENQRDVEDGARYKLSQLITQKHHKSSWFFVELDQRRDIIKHFNNTIWELASVPMMSLEELTQQQLPKSASGREWKEREALHRWKEASN